MPKRKTRFSSQNNTIFFIGVVVITAIVAYKSGLVNSFRTNVLGEEDQTTPTETQVDQQPGETEIQGPNGTIHTKVEDNGAFQVQGAKPDFQFKLEDQNGQQELHVEDTKGNTLQEREQQQLEKDLEDEGIDISTEDGKFALSKNNVKALSDMPLSVDTTRKQIMVTTPNGNTVPLILPDVAIEHLTSFGILTNFGSGSATLSTGVPSETLSLSSTNNIPTYTVPGFKDEHLLGVFPVQVPVNAVVSAQTGALMERNQDFFSKLLDSISF